MWHERFVVWLIPLVVYTPSSDFTHLRDSSQSLRHLSIWHNHILDTAKYREDCDTLFGKFMDHWPYFGMKDEAEREELNNAFSDTQALMAAHFGKSS